MVEIGGVWLLAVLAGLPLFAAMALAAFAFVQLAGCRIRSCRRRWSGDESFPIIARRSSS